jgi:hypothetical protein
VGELRRRDIRLEVRVDERRPVDRDLPRDPGGDDGRRDDEGGQHAPKSPPGPSSPSPERRDDDDRRHHEAGLLRENRRPEQCADADEVPPAGAPLQHDGDPAPEPRHQEHQKDVVVDHAGHVREDRKKGNPTQRAERQQSMMRKDSPQQAPNRPERKQAEEDVEEAEDAPANRVGLMGDDPIDHGGHGVI